ncbi:hypothetical protein [Desulfosporosinus acidiphilus]|uniref:hypothetical protein n=1 Tax=Desulfosporosinus acidiphilus TaxID=885581 RepID=UPI000257A96C|nr:hypothetical protein [Desulfosporosinus acidiphilus]
MVDLNNLDKQCPKCSGLGRMENPAWIKFWTKDWFRALDTEALYTDSKNKELRQPSEPMFFICKECHGKGKVLTDEGKRLIGFIRFWINPNY